jgi:NTP pyrophosphatase (non-canonical NTP hydrolase)
MKRQDLDNLAALLRKFANERDWEQFHSPKNLAMALTVETAELLEHFQWMTEGESAKPNPEKLQQIREEIGDVLIYLTRFADKLGIDPLDAAYKKLEINRLKYPVDKAKGTAKKYTEL